MIKIRQILAVAVMLLLPLTSGAEETDSLRMLWIGNSYTFFNDLPSGHTVLLATGDAALAGMCDRKIELGV